MIHTHGLAVLADERPNIGQLRVAVEKLTQRATDSDTAVSWYVGAETLPFTRESDDAHRWLRRESERVLDIAAGQQIRLTVAKFVDGWALVVVGDRRAADRATLGRLMKGLDAAPRRAGTSFPPTPGEEVTAAENDMRLGVGWDSVEHAARWSQWKSIGVARRTIDHRNIARLHQAALAAISSVLGRYASTRTVTTGMLENGTETPIVLCRNQVCDPEHTVSQLCDAFEPAVLLANSIPLDRLRMERLGHNGRLDTALLVIDTIDNAFESNRIHYDLGKFDEFAMTAHLELHGEGKAALSFHASTAIVSAIALEQFATDVARFCGDLLDSEDSASVGHRRLASSRRGCTPGVATLDALTGTIIDSIRDRARDQNAVAVVDGSESMSYRDLYSTSGRFCAGLRAEGIGVGDRVAVCLPRSIELVVAVFGVIRAGAAYVPIDPDWPADRCQYVLSDAGARLLIGDAERVAGFDSAAVTVEGILNSVEPTACVDDDLSDPSLPAYVIYTSGSTGRPKGVEIPQENIMRLVAAGVRLFSPDEQDNWTFFHSAAFDFSVWEIWGCLATGGRLVIVPYFVARSPDEFWQLIRRERITIASQTPSAFGQLVAAAVREPDSTVLRLIVLGGAALDPAPALRWFDLIPEHVCRVVNMYGITETTVHVTAEPLTRLAVLTNPRNVGRPLPGWGLEIRDGSGSAVPPFVRGEIWVSGIGLAHGYVNRPELTAERFVTDPETDVRYYRSGDIGRALPDGRIEHLGRMDNQVKIRGYRIELDEVRGVLLEQPEIESAVVVTRAEPDDPQDVRICAYLVGRAPLSRHEIRRRAAQRLPGYMLPSRFAIVDSFPLTPNGKVDVDALNRLTLHNGAAEGAVQPRNDIDTAVHQIWSRLFGIEVDDNSDFFELGGNSLLAVAVSNMLEESGFPPLPVRELYRGPNPRAVANYYATISDGVR